MKKIATPPGAKGGKFYFDLQRAIRSVRDSALTLKINFEIFIQEKPVSSNQNVIDRVLPMLTRIIFQSREKQPGERILMIGRWRSALQKPPKKVAAAVKMGSEFSDTGR